MKSKFLFILSTFVFLITLFSFANLAFADNTSGYAWSENSGWIDFSQVTVTDTILSGYAYSSNIGWISLNCSDTSSCGVVDYKVSNSNGVLSGYAWSENTGYIDFSKATINTNTGIFTGYAYSSNIGWISLNCSDTSSCGVVDYKVTTLWRPPTSSSSSPGGAVPVWILQQQSSKIQNDQTLNSKPTKNPNCLPGELFNSNTGFKCNIIISSNSFKFTRILKLNMTGNDVKKLQEFLNTHNFSLANTGVGSSGKETNKFGLLTKKSLILFQKKNNLNPDGILGPKTFQIINQILLTNQ